jgi:methionyl-tRNA formyltransferase
MKVIFFGTPEISIPFLKMLIEDNNIKVVAAVTMPDKPVGRKREVTKTPVKIIAEENEIEVLQPEQIDDDFAGILKKYNADFNVVISYGQILPTSVLSVPKYGSLNVHFSLLPKYRGASPVQTALLNGDKETGISIIKMSEKLDQGDIYIIKKVEIDENETSEALLKRLAELGAIMIPSALRDIADDILTPIPQNNENASYCHKITKKDAEIDPNNGTAEEIYNKYRAFQPWPGIFMIYKEKRFKLINIEKTNKPAIAGELIASDSELILGTVNGSLKINLIQPEGKKPMTDKDFINGFL